MPLELDYREVDAASERSRFRQGLIVSAIAFLLYAIEAASSLIVFFSFSPATYARYAAYVDVIGQVYGWTMFTGACLLVPRRAGRNALPVTIRILMAAYQIWRLFLLSQRVAWGLRRFYFVSRFPWAIREMNDACRLVWASCIILLLVIICRQRNELHLRARLLWTLTIVIAMQDGFVLSLSLYGDFHHSYVSSYPTCRSSHSC